MGSQMTDTCKACQAELAQLRSEKAAIVAKLEAAQRLRDAAAKYSFTMAGTDTVLCEALAAFDKEQQ